MRQNEKAALPKCQTCQSSSRINLSCERKTSQKLHNDAGEHEQQGRFAMVLDGFQICRVMIHVMVCLAASPASGPSLSAIIARESSARSGSAGCASELPDGRF